MSDSVGGRILMKSVLALSFMVIGIIYNAKADTWEDPITGYTWKYRINNDKVEIRSGMSPKPTGDLNIPSTLAGKPVTSIGYTAFFACSDLTGVTFPQSVIEIDSQAFDGCYALHNLVLPENLTSIGFRAFAKCISVTSVRIPNGVKHIGEEAFYDCSYLASVAIPDSVVDVGFDAFENCNKNLYDTTTIPGTRIVDGWVIGWTNSLSRLLNINSVCGIANMAFRNCSNLREVEMSDGLKHIGVGAFDGCSSLKSVIIPDSVQNIVAGYSTYVSYYPYHQEVGVFSNCRNLEQVTIGGNVTNIGAYAFYKCSGLTSVIIPDSVTSIGDSAFDGCVELKTAYLPVVCLESTNAFPTSVNIIRYKSRQNVVLDVADGFVSPVSLIVEWNKKYGQLPTPERFGYEFHTWMYNSVSIDSDTVVSATNDHTLVAQWTPHSHVVAFDANGGTGGRSGTQDYGTAIVAPTVTRTGYDFTGWSPEVVATVPDNDVTYTAQWEAKQYIVTFDANGGVLSDGSGSKLVTYDVAYGALPTPALEFCTFDGWMLGGMVVTPSTKVATAANHTLVARWSRWGARILPSAVSPGQTLRELYPDDYASLTTVVLEEGITELPVGFFDGCDNVESLTLPESLETLGYDDLPTKIRASLDYGADGFMVYQGWVLGYDNDDASTLTLPQNAIGIGTRAFAEFWDLERVTIPNTVKRIGREAFYECTFLDDVEIPDSVVTVAHGAFENCSYMQTLSVGNGVRKVADRAFARCASLQAVSFADGLESVGEYAFSNDWRMLSVSLPHSVTNIADGAFAACRRVKGVSVPANVMTLADMFPAAYSNIESVVVASGETDIMDDMFNGCSALTDFTWSGSETNVGERAFLGCEALVSVAMPDSVVRIGAAAFKGCSSLRDLTLSRSLVALPDFVFEECGALDSFIVPASVTSLGEGFVYESAVSAIYYLGNAPEYDPNAYANVAANFVTYVVRGTRGWDGTPSSRVLPEDWIGHEITYWTPNRFDVTFDANGGYFGESSVTQWAEQQITDMGYVLPNQNPVHPGYAFEEWWTEAAAGAQVKYSTQVTATRPHTLYAHWRLHGNLITATFNANGGTVVVPGSQNYVAGQTFGELPVPSRRGYAFCGWWTEASDGERISEATSVPAADIELFAHWEPIRYFVVYDANGGTGTMTNQVHVYDTPKMLDENLFSRTGYAFSGWARSADGQVEYADRAEVVNLAEVSNEVVRLYAVWSGAGYNVRFDSNGGTGVMENQTIQISETQNLHTNAFVFSGREFLGWATESDGAVAYRDGEAVCGLSSVNGATVHLYAVWRVSDATWMVTFDGNGGSVAPGHWNVARSESLDALPTPTRPGYAFMGWWTQRFGGASVTPPFAVTSTMTLYAHWRAYDDPLPPVSGDTGVAAVMGDFADLRLGENVKTVDEYNALVEWADEKGIDHQAVRTSTHVWVSYVLGTAVLLENEPEIEFESVEVCTAESGTSGAESPNMTVSVAVKDGERMVAVDAAKVAAMFEATSDLGDWDGEAKLTPAVQQLGTVDGAMRFKVTPGDGNSSKAFLRIRR